MHTLLGSRRNPRRPNRCSRCNPRSNLYQNETGAVFPKGTAAPVFCALFREDGPEKEDVMKAKEKQLLEYLKKTDIERYRALIAKLNLRK